MSVPQWNADIITPASEAGGTQVIGDNQEVQTTLESGDNITIEDGKISATGDLDQVQSDWTESDTTDPSYIQNKPTINNVPAVTSSDDNKVLKATYSEGVGSYAWATGGGGSSYTAGNGIAIDQNNEVSVRIKDAYDNALKFTQEQGGGGDADLWSPEGTPSSEGWKAMTDNGYIKSEYDSKDDVTHIEFRYSWNRVDSNPLGMQSTGDDTKHFDAKCHLLYISSKESYTDIVATSSTVSDAFTAAWDASDEVCVYSLGSIVDTTYGYVFQIGFTLPGDVGGVFNAIAFSASGQDFSVISDTVQSSFLNENHVLALQGYSVYIVGDTIPGGDLYVQVDQTYDDVSALPQSGYAVAEALSYVNQVPTASESDVGKALVYDEGARWTDQSSASIARDGSALEVRLRNANSANNSGLAVSTTDTPTSITGTVTSGGPNSSYYATFTKSVSLDPDTDTVNIVGLAESIPSGVTSPVYAVVVAGDTWQSGTLTGGFICDLNSSTAINLSDPSPCKASVMTDPSDQYATSTFFNDVNTFMVYGVSADYVYYDHGSFYGSFIDEWTNNGLYSALEQYAVALTQPSGSVTFEIPSRPTETRGLYVANPLPAATSADEGKVLTVDNSGAAAWGMRIQQVNALPASPDANTLYLIPEA
jgi:hypothetical protein